MINNIDELILAGALEVYGVDPQTGEFLYSFTEKLKEVSPKTYAMVTNKVSNTVSLLWEKGFLNMDMSQENPEITLKSKAFDKAEVKGLSIAEINVLEAIIRSIAE